MTRVVTEDLDPDPGEKPFTATRLEYAKNGRTVTFAVGERWTDDYDYEILWGREYRYDGARERYLDRELDPLELMDDNIVPLSETWSDYDGGSIYGDFEVDGQESAATKWYEPGLAETDDPLGSPVTRHVHGDMIGSVRFLTDADGMKHEEAVYTGFGELVTGSARRYGFAGFYGYQTDTATQMPFIHVGERYYDPAVGRFLQRDSIGILGGLNVYEYVWGDPVNLVDPEGDTPETPSPGGTAGMLNPKAAREVAETLKMLGKATGGGRTRVAGKISGYTKHAINQAISREGKGVAAKVILQTVRNPKAWKEMADGTIRYYGKFAEVRMRPDGVIITVIRKSSVAARCGT